MKEDELEELIGKYRREMDWFLEDNYRENNRTLLCENDFAAMREVATSRRLTLPPQLHNPVYESKITEKGRAELGAQRKKDNKEFNKKVRYYVRHYNEKRKDFSTYYELYIHINEIYLENDREDVSQAEFVAIENIARKNSWSLPAQEESNFVKGKMTAISKVSGDCDPEAPKFYGSRWGKRSWLGTELRPGYKYVSRNEQIKPKRK